MAAQVYARLAVVALLCGVPTLGHPAGHGGNAHRGGNHRIRVTPDLQPEPGFLFTAESNIYRSSLYANAFLEYQTADFWNLGLYVINMPLRGSSQSFEYDAYVSIAKWWRVAGGGALAHQYGDPERHHAVPDASATA